LLFKARKGRLPIQICGVLLRRSQHPVEAASLLSFLTSRGAASRFRQCGFLAMPKSGQRAPRR
jgi:hypothetical protein